MAGRQKLAAVCVTLVAVLVGVLAAGAPAAPSASVEAAPTRFGVSDDAGKYAEDRGEAAGQALQDLGMQVQRWTLKFDPANPAAISEAPFLDRALPVAANHGIEVMLSLFQKGAAAPDKTEFCAWAKTVAERWPQVRRFVVGNEVNALRFWSPQKTEADRDAGPKSYYAVLAACYDALKEVSPQIQVLGFAFAPRAVTTTSTKPLAFLRKVGELYKVSGRTAPLMDAIAVHPYPNPNANPPPAPAQAAYQDPDFFGIPQLDRVKAAVFAAFNGTYQPTTANGLTIVVAEVGYQSDTRGDALYTGDEVSPTVSEGEQASYHAQVVALYACDPLVTDVLFFGLYDEKQRSADASSGGWQAGMLRPNGDKKPSHDAVKAAITAGCTASQVAWAPPAAAVLLAPGAAAPAPAPAPVAPEPAPAATAPASALTEADRSAARAAAETKELELNLLAYEREFEALPAAAHDGTAGLVPIPGLSNFAVELAAKKMTDGMSVWFPSTPGVTLPAVFWRLPLSVREPVAMRAVTVLLPGCHPHFAERSGSRWVLGTCKSSLTEHAPRGSGGFVIERYREITANVRFTLSQGSVVVKFCLGGLAIGGADVGEPSEVCAIRTLNALGAKVKKLPFVVLAEGGGTLKAGATLGGKMKRLRGAQVGVVRTFIVMQSKKNPASWMSIALRPAVITPSDIVRATKTRQAKEKKAKGAKKGKKPALKAGASKS